MTIEEIVKKYRDAEEKIKSARVDKAECVKEMMIMGIGYEEMAKLIGTTYQNLQGFYKRYAKLKVKQKAEKPEVNIKP